jgi:hypothetical protein
MLREAGIDVDPDEPFPEARPPLHALAGGDERPAPRRPAPDDGHAANQRGR